MPLHVDSLQDNKTAKIVLLGESGVGKTSIILSLSKKSITNDHIATIGAGYF